jgi:5-amino-6-(5-phosphoribosylamino)uracil reductase
MRRLLPLPALPDVDLDALTAHYAYPAAPDQPTSGRSCTVRANMVSSIDGAIALDGRSKPISSEADWYLFGLQRALADVIMVGAGTARAEGYGPGRARPEFAQLRQRSGQPPAPTLALVTRSGSLEADADYLGGAARPIVITCESGRRNLGRVTQRADVIVAGDTDVDLSAALSELVDRGHLRVLTEGGPHLLGSLLDADLIDELTTSLSPVVVGGDSRRMVQSAVGRVRTFDLVGLLESDGALFLHYRSEGTT